MERAVFWFFLTLTALGDALVAAVVVKALGPERGAMMILMGLPLVALPTALFAAFAVALAWSADRLSRWEQRAAYALGVPALVGCVPLAVLG